MPVMYNTVEEESRVDIPDWSSLWPASGGCTPRTNVRTGVHAYPPSTSTAWYEPSSVVESQSSHVSGFMPGRRPPYGYTPYGVSKVTTKNYLLRRRFGSQNTHVWHQYGVVANLPPCTAVGTSSEEIAQVVRYWTITHTFPYTNYTINSILSADVNYAIATVENDVACQALTQYDLLTEVAEAREIPELVRSISSELFSILRSLGGRYSINDLRTASHLPIVQLLKNPRRIIRALGNEWMRYRYAIMPLVYSYRDAVKTLKRGQNLRTRKAARVTPTPTGVTLPASTTKYLWTETVGSETIRGNVLQHFDSESGAQLSGIGLNPLVTAWELIPYSFVVDWFVDVGSYITRTTSQPQARTTFACISRRSEYTVKTWAHYNKEDLTLSPSSYMPTIWTGPLPPTPPSITISRPEESQLLKEVVTNSYSRWTFPLSAAKLNFMPSLNWRRYLDSVVMANNQLGTFNRFLKGL